MAYELGEIDVRFWNGYYYCRGILPDGTKSPELKSKDDLSFEEWKMKLKEYYDASQIPPGPEPNECQCPECQANFVCPNRGT